MVSAMDLNRGAYSVMGQRFTFSPHGVKIFLHVNGIQSESLDILFVVSIDCHQCSDGNVNKTLTYTGFLRPKLIFQSKKKANYDIQYMSILIG